MFNSSLNNSLTRGDKREILSWGLPSTKRVNVTLGASDTVYTAPADGWFCLRKSISAAGQYAQMISNNNMMAISNSIHTVGWAGIIECQKGDEIKITYNLGGNTSAFIFVYAEGEK